MATTTTTVAREMLSRRERVAGQSALMARLGIVPSTHDAENVEMLRFVSGEISNSIRHLEASNRELEAALSEADDDDFRQALEENEGILVSKRQLVADIEALMATLRTLIAAQGDGDEAHVAEASAAAASASGGGGASGKERGHRREPEDADGDVYDEDDADAEEEEAAWPRVTRAWEATPARRYQDDGGTAGAVAATEATGATSALTAADISKPEVTPGAAVSDGVGGVYL